MFSRQSSENPFDVLRVYGAGEMWEKPAVPKVFAHHRYVLKEYRQQ
jgi:hypothetical protein